MERFIRSRMQDPRFNSKPVQMRTGHEVTRWAPTQYYTVSRVNANKPEANGSKNSNVSEKRKESDGAKSESESEDEDGEKKKKKKKKEDKKEDKEPGKATNDPCWKGYERDESVPKYKPGSCKRM